MTAAARISQAEIDRATKSVKKAGHDRARIIMDLANQKIEIIIGDPSPESQGEKWSDTDV